MSDVYRQSWERVPEGPKPDRRPEYTPTVEEVRDGWVWYMAETSDRNLFSAEDSAEFDRMIAAVERAAEVKALRAAARLVWVNSPQGPESEDARDRIEAEADRIESGESA